MCFLHYPQKLRKIRDQGGKLFEFFSVSRFALRVGDDRDASLVGGVSPEFKLRRETRSSTRERDPSYRFEEGTLPGRPVTADDYISEIERRGWKRES
jgi:hypothetical protein